MFWLSIIEGYKAIGFWQFPCKYRPPCFIRLSLKPQSLKTQISPLPSYLRRHSHQCCPSKSPRSPRHPNCHRGPHHSLLHAISYILHWDQWHGRWLHTTRGRLVLAQRELAHYRGQRQLSYDQIHHYHRRYQDLRHWQRHHFWCQGQHQKWCHIRPASDTHRRGL